MCPTKFCMHRGDISIAVHELCHSGCVGMVISSLILFAVIYCWVLTLLVLFIIILSSSQKFPNAGLCYGSCHPI
jgi:hypothetical protein